MINSTGAKADQCSGWLTQCHQVWALQEEQAQALKGSVDVSSASHSQLGVWALILQEPAKARDELQCACACWSSCNWRGIVVSLCCCALGLGCEMLCMRLRVAEGSVELTCWLPQQRQCCVLKWWENMDYVGVWI